eukprot:5458942-Amphidinium_carterae.1
MSQVKFSDVPSRTQAKHSMANRDWDNAVVARHTVYSRDLLHGNAEVSLQLNGGGDLHMTFLLPFRQAHAACYSHSTGPVVSPMAAS